MLRILYYLCTKSGKISAKKGGWAYVTSWAYNTYSTVCSTYIKTYMYVTVLSDNVIRTGRNFSIETS